MRLCELAAGCGLGAADGAGLVRHAMGNLSEQSTACAASAAAMWPAGQQWRANARYCLGRASRIFFFFFYKIIRLGVFEDPLNI